MLTSFGMPSTASARISHRSGDRPEPNAHQAERSRGSPCHVVRVSEEQVFSASLAVSRRLGYVPHGDPQTLGDLASRDSLGEHAARDVGRLTAHLHDSRVGMSSGVRDLPRQVGLNILDCVQRDKVVDGELLKRAFAKTELGCSFRRAFSGRPPCGGLPSGLPDLGHQEFLSPRSRIVERCAHRDGECMHPCAASGAPDVAVPLALR